MWITRLQRSGLVLGPVLFALSPLFWVDGHYGVVGGMLIAVSMVPWVYGLLGEYERLRRPLPRISGLWLLLVLIGMFGMWNDTMKTVSMIMASTLISIAIGLPLGILMSRSKRVQSVLNPVLDVMQTMPSFVYLIPVVMLLGIGRVPGLIAVVIYALPPMIRLTNLGIRQVDREVLEAADAFGSSAWQKLIKAELPLALPTIMAGINQTIMMALAMVVIASMIGVQGLGQPVLKAISNQYFTLGLFNGFAIVGIAILFDRISQAWGQRLQKHREASHV